MNETLNTIYNRRSIRSYDQKEVSKEILSEILKAGSFSASARNMQSSIIIMVNNKDIHNKLVELGTNIRGMDPFYGAPHMILVLSKKETFCPIQDGSLVLGNMMLAAKSLGVGSCWINCLKDILELPEAKELKETITENGTYIPVGALIVGYPKDDVWPEAKERKEDYIRYI